MKAISIRYGFSQSFAVPASAAYRWCTDYRPDDLALMGERGSRTVRRISEDAFILKDPVYRGDRRFTKTKLVRLSPERLSWTNTHIAGPNKHSQFIYEIVADGEDGSRLKFTGLQINYVEEEPSRKELEEIGRRLADEDSGAWKLLAKAMEKDLSRS
jgi:hypothetical protein